MTIDDDLDVEVRFPAHYPDGCPSVRPVPFKILSAHQYKANGVFCLELGPDNWHANHTVAELLRSTWRLVNSELFLELDEPIEIPSRHVSDLNERLLLSPVALLRSHEFDRAVAEISTPTAFEVVRPGRGLRFVPVSVPTGTALDDLSRVLRDGTRLTGLFVPLGEGAPSAAPTENQGFDDFVNKHGGVRLADEIVVMLRWPDGAARAFMRVSEPVSEMVNVPFLADDRRLPKVFDRLVDARVAIVGLGSLGSKIAVSLARSGCRRFVLVDGAALLGHNVCRHAATFTDVGSFKVDAVRDHIRAVAATSSEVSVHKVNVLAATHPEVHAGVVEDIRSCDIVIDATAEPEVFGLVAGIASDNRVPLVWGEVFGGGIGGLIASASPDDTPCPRCVRQAFIEAAAAWPPAPSRQMFHPYGAHGVPLVASDADVGMIAAAMTARVFKVLEGGPVPSVTVVGFRRDWIFEQPLDSRHVRVRTDDHSCPRCWTPDSDAEPAALAEAERLFSGGDADTSHPE